VLLGNGDGTFQPAVTYDAGAWVTLSVVVGDVNGDGYPDLVVTSNCSGPDTCGAGGVVSVLLGNGDGTFRSAVAYSTGGQEAISVAIGDVNEDGKQDLVVADSTLIFNDWGSGGGMSALLGNGDGTFQSPVSFSSGGIYATSIAIRDVNGDGKPDLIVSNACQTISDCAYSAGTGSVSVLLGNGDGTFQSPVSYSSGWLVAESVAVGDVNGDGKPDMVVANSSTSGSLVGVLLGNGDGTFQTVVTYPLGGWSVAIAIADVNRDGQPDLLVTDYNSVGVLLNNKGAPPTTSFLAASVNPVNLKQAVTYTATVASQSGGTLTGTVTFQDNGTPVANVTLANNQAAYSTSYASEKMIGAHSMTASYSGVYQSAEGSQSTLTEYVRDAITKTVAATSESPSTFGQPVTFTATVTAPKYGPIPDGELVTFYYGTTAIGRGTTVGGVATFTTSSLTTKTRAIDATYAGDTTFKPSSGSVSQVVDKATTTTALASSQNPAKLGQSVTFTASVAPEFSGTPTREVAFHDGATLLKTVALSGGVAKFTTSTLASGAHSITATYNGNEDFTGSTSAPVNQVVLVATMTTLTSSPNPSTYGQTVTFTATVTSSLGAPPPDGEIVSFMKGTTVLGTATLSGGSASFTTSTLPVSTNAIKAVYGGDSNLPGSTSKALSQVVSKATTTTALASSQDPSIYGQPVTFTAMVAPQFSGTPTGSVVFKDGTKTLKTVALSGGAASYTTSTLATGTHSITATYNGSASFGGSSASVTQTVN
jgi:hypothetical protein